MPNQDPAQNPNPVNPPVDQPVSPIVPPAISPQSDLPPLSPDFQNLPGNDVPATPSVSQSADLPTEAPAQADQPISNDAGSSAPPDISSVISKPKKKFGGGKIIATILGLIVLIGGVGAGIVLTQQKQLFQQKASGTVDCGAQTCNTATQVCCISGCKEIAGGGCGETGAKKCSADSEWDTRFGIEFSCRNKYEGYTYCSQMEETDQGYIRNCVAKDFNGNPSPMQSDGTYFCHNEITSTTCDSHATPTPGPTDSPIVPPTGRQDYCVSSTINKAEVNSGEEVVVSSTSNTNVNGFFYAAYNSDNLYGPGNPKPVCTGTGSDPQCPNGGTPLIFSDLNNRTDGGGLRKFGSVKIPYASLFVVDKSTGQQVKSVQFNAYFSLNGGEWSVPNANCVVYVKATPASKPTPTPTPTPTPAPPIQLNCNSACYQMDASMECGQGLSCLNASSDPNTLILKCRNPQCSLEANCICPTAPPTVPLVAPSCIAVNAYDSNWTLIERTQLPSLAVGATVNFCVNGSATSGTFDKAQFMINTILKSETMTIRPSSNDFCQSYTILSTDTTVSVRAKIHSSTGVWVGESI